MSDNTSRRIEGLKPRDTAPLSRLLKSERTAAPSEPAAPTLEVVAPDPAEQQRPQTKPRSRRAAAPTSSRKPSATFYIPEALQARGRAAYRATAHIEGDESYSHMAAKAYEAEVVRREQLYNNGEPFGGGQGPLPAGRPLQL
jgi:hypothetical protein